MKYDNLPPLVGGPYWYVASPYTKFPGGHQAAFELACVYAAKFAVEGVPTFSPIAHSHPMAVYGNLPKVDHDFWMRVDEPMMDGAGGMILVTMDGWEDSAGVAHEMKRFLEAGKWVAFYDPETDLIVGRAKAMDFAEEVE